jgi:hypothetical protein
MTATVDQFCAAVRTDDVATVSKLLQHDPSLAKLRWPGRAGDGRMRSLGPSPFNQHTWLNAPDDHAPDDPRYTSTPLIYSRNDEIVRLLVDAGADVNARGTSGDIETPDWFYTPLWRAAHDGRLAGVRLLVERAVDVNYATPDGANQALKTAAENDRAAVCDYLLARGARPDVITAAMLGLEDHVREIITGHPEAIHQRDAHQRTALDAATLLDTFRVNRGGFHAGHASVARLLIDAGAPVGLAHAASLGDLETVRRILTADPDAARRPVQLIATLGGTAVMESPLHAARRNGHTEGAALLLQCRAVEHPPVSWS